MELAFGHPIAALEGDSGGDGAEVVPQSLGAAGLLRGPAAGRFGHPRRQLMPAAPPYESQRGLDQCMGARATLASTWQSCST